MTNDPEQLIEMAGRTCYKSEDGITSDSARKFVAKIAKRGHFSVIEHAVMTVRFICDRGVTHELVRHRLCSFSQESTRYCNYSKQKFGGGQLTFIIPPWVDLEPGEYHELGPNPLKEGDADWFRAMSYAEECYLRLIDLGWSPQQARSVLPNSLKTEIVTTANFREWEHIFQLRCASAAHPQMREMMIPLASECKEKWPSVFAAVEL